MKFGPVAIDKAEGAILAHAVNLPVGRLKKGKLLLGKDILALAKAGIDTVIVARLEARDIEENEAAALIGKALASNNIANENPFTGRVNLHVEKAGIFRVDADAVDAINRIDPSITIATLPEYSAVQAGRMVATVKIIPFAVEQKHLEAATEVCNNLDVLKLKPFRQLRVGMIATTLPSLKPATMDKTRRVLEARLAPSGSHIVQELRVLHEIDAVSGAIGELSNNCDLIILFGASAIIDRQDVIPSALEKAGGNVTHFGMPVDPGNLLLLGSLGDIRIIGAPGCARSPSLNGFDWILQRILAGVEVNGRDIEGLGVGGLLMEIHSRPQPREPVVAQETKVHAIILAAGQSRRMGKVNKLMAQFNGKPLLRHVVDAALASRVDGITLVTGHEPEKVARLVENDEATVVHNPDYETGLASSLRCGIEAIPDGCSGALVLLGDMPQISSSMIDRLLDEFARAPQAAIIQATDQGKRGNPVLWSASYFEALKMIEGDVGARHLIGQNAEQVVEVELGEAASLDIDTPDNLQQENNRGE